MSHINPAIGFPQPREPFDRTLNSRGFKPAAMPQVRVGGWVEVYVGNAEKDFSEKRFIFGRVAKIAYLHQRIYFQIDDQAFSREIIGLEDGWTLELELEDLCASEFSPAQMKWEAEYAMEEERRQLFERYEEEFLRRWSQFNLRQPCQRSDLRRGGMGPGAASLHRGSSRVGEGQRFPLPAGRGARPATSAGPVRHFDGWGMLSPEITKLDGVRWFDDRKE